MDTLSDVSSLAVESDYPCAAATGPHNLVPMEFNQFDREQRFRDAWEAVKIERPVHYGLFTFGESELPYFLVCDSSKPGALVEITRGEVRVKRPTIITPGDSRPEFHNFFEDPEDEGMVQFLLAREAVFSHLTFDNHSGPTEFASDNVEESVAKLNRKLDSTGEDRVAILSSPREFAGIAVLKFATDRVVSSARDNVQELRERGMLP